MQARRLAALVLTLSLVSAACGARLTEEQEALAIGGSFGLPAANPDQGGTVPPGTLPPGSVPTDTDPGTPAQTSAPGTPGQPAPSATAPGQTAAPTAAPTSGGSGTPSQPAPSGQPTSSPTTQAPAQPADTRAAPAGGNGGATDVGVTATEIVVFNVADVTGPVPGIFADARQATQAYFNMFAQTEGTVFGRQIRLVARDSKLDSTGNRQAYLAACDEAFAAVGSMSAADDGATSAVNGCGIPDLRTAAVNGSLQEAATVYGMDAMKPGLLPTSEYQYWKEQHPEAVKKAAYLWINNATTQFQTRQNIGGTKNIGYTWVYDQPIDVTETNYATFVIEMKNKGVEFVTIQGAYQQAAKLAQTMREQNFTPKVYALQANVYTPDLIKTGGTDVEGAMIAATGVLVEESGNAELDKYAAWLQSVDPDAKPTGLGLYAWSASANFIEGLKAIGPEPTRAKLLDYVKGVRGYTGNGLIPPQDVGTKAPSDCVILVTIQGGKFVRTSPSSGFRCDNKVVSTS